MTHYISTVLELRNALSPFQVDVEVVKAILNKFRKEEMCLISLSEDGICFEKRIDDVIILKSYIGDCKEKPILSLRTGLLLTALSFISNDTLVKFVSENGLLEIYSHEENISDPWKLIFTTPLSFSQKRKSPLEIEGGVQIAPEILNNICKSFAFDGITICNIELTKRGAFIKSEYSEDKSSFNFAKTRPVGIDEKIVVECDTLLLRSAVSPHILTTNEGATEMVFYQNQSDENIKMIQFLTKWSCHSGNGRIISYVALRGE